MPNTPFNGGLAAPATVLAYASAGGTSASVSLANFSDEPGNLRVLLATVSSTPYTGVLAPESGLIAPTPLQSIVLTSGQLLIALSSNPNIVATCTTT